MSLIGSDYDKLRHGDIAPDFDLKGTDKNMHRLADIKGEHATLIVFICNHCPYVKPKLKELNRIADDYLAKGLVVIGINSNESINYPEDRFMKMQEMVQYGKIKFLYLHDESQNVAKIYGAVCTPDPYLFDSELKLILHSRIDNTHGPIPTFKHEMYEAIGEFLQTGKITKREKPSMGCSIKWRH